MRATEDFGLEYRHGAADQRHRVSQGANRLRQELMQPIVLVKNVAYYGRIQFGSHQSEQLFIVFPLRHIPSPRQRLFWGSVFRIRRRF